VNVKRAFLRARADQDVHEAIDYYLGEGAEQAALNFIDALEQTLQHIGRHPAISRSLR
jgi:toxin ParE1/3/4